MESSYPSVCLPICMYMQIKPIPILESSVVQSLIIRKSHFDGKMPSIGFHRKTRKDVARAISSPHCNFSSRLVSSSSQNLFTVFYVFDGTPNQHTLWADIMNSLNKSAQLWQYVCTNVQLLRFAFPLSSTLNRTMITCFLIIEVESSRIEHWEAVGIPQILIHSVDAVISNFFLQSLCRLLYNFPPCRNQFSPCVLLLLRNLTCDGLDYL